jgi:hypothetical protein
MGIFRSGPVRYEAVNAMLLNEFLKAHRRIEEQDKRIDQLTAQLKEQAEQIRKVNDKVEMNRPAPHVVVDSRGIRHERLCRSARTAAT